MNTGHAYLIANLHHSSSGWTVQAFSVFSEPSPTSDDPRRNVYAIIADCDGRDYEEAKRRLAAEVRQQLPMLWPDVAALFF